jgi:hypothetical protein
MSNTNRIKLLLNDPLNPVFNPKSLGQKKVNITVAVNLERFPSKEQGMPDIYGIMQLVSVKDSVTGNKILNDIPLFCSEAQLKSFLEQIQEFREDIDNKEEPTVGAPGPEAPAP